MKTLIFFALSFSLYFIPPSSSAQDIPEFGEASQAALLQEKYPADAEAEAAILFDMCKASFERSESGVEMRFRHRRRIKFYGEANLDKANISLPYYAKDAYQTEWISGIRACVINWENGKAVRHEISKADIFDEETSESWQTKKFALPHVKPGSIIEYEYTKTSPYLLTFDWRFQHDIPVAWSEYQIDIPPFYDYQMELQGRTSFAMQDQQVTPLSRTWGSVEFKDARFRWGMKDLPAFGNEPFITTPLDYIITMKFQLAVVEFPGQDKTTYLKDWPGFVKDLLTKTDYGKSLGKKNGKELILPYVEELKGEEKARKVYELVTSRLHWDGRRSRYPSASTKEVLEQGEGNSTDINIWLCNMLNVADIEAYPVLLSTRDHGKINVKYPFIDDFNTTVVYIELEDKGLLLDASHRLLPFGVIHPQCLNEEGLILNRKNPQWLKLHPNLAGLTKNMVSLSYQEESSQYIASVTRHFEGYDAANERSKFFKDENAYKNDLSEEEILNFSVEDAEEIEKPFIVKFSCEVPVQISGDRIFIDPFFLEKMEENPFQSPERSFAVDYTYSKKRIYYFSLAIPKGYEVESLPENVQYKLDNNAVSLLVKVENIANFTLDLNRQFEVNSPLVQPGYYQQLRHLYDLRVKAETTQIVLKKMP